MRAEEGQGYERLVELIIGARIAAALHVVVDRAIADALARGLKLQTSRRRGPNIQRHRTAARAAPVVAARGHAPTPPHSGGDARHAAYIIHQPLISPNTGRRI